MMTWNNLKMEVDRERAIKKYVENNSQNFGLIAVAKAITLASELIRSFALMRLSNKSIAFAIVKRFYR